MKVLLITHTLALGGIGKSVAQLTSHLASKSHSVTVISIVCPNEEHFFKLDSRAKLIELPIRIDRPFATRVLSYPSFLSQLRRTIRQLEPDIIVSFMDWINVLCLCAVKGLGIPVIISERGNPSRTTLSPWFKAARRLTYRWAQGLVAVSDAVLRYFSSYSFHSRAVIPGATDIPEHLAARAAQRQAANLSSRKVIGLGRLHSEKGFDRLIDAFASISGRYPDWRLEIWGTGPEQECLALQIERLDIDATVALPGSTDRPLEHLADADIFVLSSRDGFEGSPNALMEAMALGLAVVAFDSKVGPGELIISGENGVLVPQDNHQLLAAALSRLMDSSEERMRLGQNAAMLRESISTKNLMERWIDIISKVISA